MAEVATSVMPGSTVMSSTKLHPRIKSQDSEDSVNSEDTAVEDPYVVAEIHEDGTARFHSQVLKGASSDLNAVSSESSSEEGDYAIDHTAIVDGAKGGGIEGKPLSKAKSESKSFSFQSTTTPIRPGNLRRKSIPVKLETTKVKGRYLLSADDEALKEVLQRVMKPEKPKARRRFSDLVFTRQFTAFDRQNSESASSPFHGFFTLFWLSIVFMLIRVGTSNFRATGNILGTHELITMMFSRDVLVLGISDVVMMLGTSFCLLLQKAIHQNFLTWKKSGWIIQSLWQILYISATIRWTIHREWPWQHTVFLVLHCIVMLMKQHSYGFYNGHLSEVLKRKNQLKKKLDQVLEAMGPPTAGSVQSPEAATAIATSYFDESNAKHLKRRRMSLSQAKDPKGQQDHVDITRVAETIKSGTPLEYDELLAFERVLQSELESLEKELKGKCTETRNYYPRNLTLYNFFDYIPLPTVVYELEYPRQDRINWLYVAEKTAATFGCIGVMIVVSQTWIYPVVMTTVVMKEQNMPVLERLKVFPLILDELLFPFMVEYMMAWYVIWECVLNLLAELTCFADRGFYADWWNSVSWDQFARDWNKPVHNFLLRHVYHSSIASFRISKGGATLITFLLSAIIHELVMWCIFKKLRGYLLFMQMLQLPLVMLSKTKLLKQQKLLGNIVFWIGIFTGPSLLCSLYLVI